jgi:sugar phosphate isomerase/epimerase
MSKKTPSPKVAFNTANLVGRATRYRCELGKWGEHHLKTVAATDEREWDAICGEISAAGYRAVEVWQAHADPSVMTKERAATWKKIMADHGLTPIGYAGGIRVETAQICVWLDIPVINGGLGSVTLQNATAICKASGVRFNFENHPEKGAKDILQKIDGGNAWVGACIDTGWLGTQGADAKKVVKACLPVLRHLHAKDVMAPGRHDTTGLGDGCVDLEGVVRLLKRAGWKGWYSWEDEPEDRNPMLSAAANRAWLEKQLR